MKKSLFLQAFEGSNTTVPVWFMRQAGRCLPQYQELRKKHELDELFRNPELAAEITALPVRALNVDAAILFADILTLPSLMGVEVTFRQKTGPVIKHQKNFLKLDDIRSADYVEKTCRLSKERLGDDTPLIGFAGSPFTVLTYLAEGKSGLSFNKTVKFIEEDPRRCHQWMEKLTINTITYLQSQIRAGAEAVQLFDTWAGMLRASDYARWVLPYVQRVFDALDVPSIYYVKNCNHLLSLMDKTSADFLSVCQTVVLGHHTVLERTQKGIQGNLYNGLLYADPQTLSREVRDCLLGGTKHKKYIFNLSHGVFPDVSVDVLKRIVEQVHAFKWKK